MPKLSDIVFSTNPDWSPVEETTSTPTLDPKQQDLRIHRESKHRGGKTVSIIRGFQGSDNDLDELAKMLKTKCGVGGSAKNGEIIIQGDCRDKIFEILSKAGFRCKKAGS